MTKGEREGRRKLWGILVTTSNTQETKEGENYNLHHHNVPLWDLKEGWKVSQDYPMWHYINHQC
jgi:hypothetical protein